MVEWDDQKESEWEAKNLITILMLQGFAYVGHLGSLYNFCLKVHKWEICDLIDTMPSSSDDNQLVYLNNEIFLLL